MPACSKCGFENLENANFCSRCGTRLVHPDPADTTITYAPMAGEDTEDEPLSPLEDVAAPVLLVRSGGDREGDRIEISSDLLTIGRAPESDLFLDDVTVSRHHARVIRDAAGYVVEDQNSLNGTYVNRRRVERHHLTDGDEVQIGKFKLAFLEPEES